MAHKWVYAFEEGDATMRNLLGGKGCNLAEMTRIGLPVPPGFTVTTEACVEYMNTGKFPEGMWEQVLAAMQDLNRNSATMPIRCLCPFVRGRASPCRA